MNCSECGKALDERYERFWMKVEGWERRREQGGTNHLALRKTLEEFMCQECMVLRQSGLNPQQLRI